MTVLFPAPASDNGGTVLFPKPPDSFFNPPASDNGVLSGIGNAAANVAQGFEQLPGNVYAAVRHPEAGLAGALNTIGEMGYHAGRGLTHVNNLIANALGVTPMQMPDDPFPSLVAKPGMAISPRGFAGGQALGYLGMPELGGEAATFGQAIAKPALNSMAYSLASGATPSQAIGSGIAGAALGAIPQVPRLGAASLLGLAKRGVDPDILAQRLSAIPEGANPSLGDVTGNRLLQFAYHDILGGIPLSGVQKNTNQLIDTSRNEASSFLNGLRNNVAPEDINQNIGQSVKNTYQDVLDNINAKKEKVNSIADDLGFQVPDRKNYVDTAVKYIKQIAAKPPSDLSGLNPGVYNDLANIAGFKNSQDLTKVIRNDMQMSPDIKNQLLDKILTPPDINADDYDYSLRSANFNKSAAREKARNASPNSFESKIYNDLAQASDKDINNAIEQHGSPELSSANTDLLQSIKNQRVPFESNDIQNIIKGKPGASLHQTLTNPKNRAVLDLLPQETKNLILYKYLEPAIQTDERGQTFASPASVANKYNAMDDDRRNALVKNMPMIDDKINKLKSLGNIVSEPLAQANNAYTGGRNVRNILSLAYLTNLAKNLYQGNYVEALKGGVGLPLAALGLGQQLRSPSLINALTTGVRPLTSTETLSNLSSLRPLQTLQGVGQLGALAIPRLGARLTTNLGSPQ